MAEAKFLKIVQNLSIFSCPICRSDAGVVKWTYRTWAIVKCPQCDVEFASPFTPGDLEYYSGNETYSRLRAQVAIGDIPPGNFAILKEIEGAVHRYVQKPWDNIRVLDYGCGSGFYAGCFQRHGCDVLGVDFNPEMLQIAQDIFKVKGLMTSAEELLKNNDRFDLIILNQVLEHVGNPVELLGQLRRLLRRGGILFISVPNRDFIRIRGKFRAGELNAGNYPPHHVSFWSIKSLNTALSAAGLKALRCSVQTYPEMMQTEISLKTRFGGMAGASRIVARSASEVGRVLGFSGVNLFAIGGSHE